MLKILSKLINKGDIWIANLEPSRKGELGKKGRPIIVIQSNDANELLDTVTVIPVSSNILQFDEIHILLKPAKQNGLAKESAAICSHIYTASKDRLTKKIGTLNNKELKEVISAVLLHLDVDIF